MEESKLKKHITMVGAVQISFSLLGLLIAFVLFFALSFARSQVGDNETGKMVLGYLIIILPLVIGFLSALGLVGGIGVLAFKSWARYLVMIVSALECLVMPIGTIFGIYAIWVLSKNETKNLINKV
jgi:hypothetical protein